MQFSIILHLHLYIWTVSEYVTTAATSPLALRWIECVIYPERDVREEQHPYISGIVTDSRPLLNLENRI